MIDAAQLSLRVLFVTAALAGAGGVNVNDAMAADPVAGVPIVYRHAGVDTGVPYTILYAIALAESGYRHPSGDAYGPWPWTLNVAGRPARFDSEAEAVAALKDVLASGVRNVDIGAAQINWKYNGRLFDSIDTALDPTTNLKAATAVLIREFDRCEKQLGRLDWWCAVESYHSPGTSDAQRARATAYAARVRRHWETLE